MWNSKLACLALLLSVCTLLNAQSPAQREFFETKVRPVLANTCLGCHNPKMHSAGLDLSNAAGFYKGGDSGPVVDKTDPENSKLLKVLGYHGAIKMPPMGKLKDEQIAAITAWVKMGAPWPDAAPAPVVEYKAGKYQFTPEQRAFWAFQPIKAYPVPEVKDKSWAKNPIDNFILAKLEEKGLTPSRPADKLTLLRRATFDLIGLPPTPKEIDDFLADASPDAFAKVVDRLLASSRYGERWGRHWLDVARYADSTGADEDIRYPYAYRYRDYVIDAFNRDLPYNQFIKEQLAGDLLPAEKPGQVNTRGIVATGFLAIGLKLLAEQDKPKMVYDMVDEQLDTTSRAFMGLTVACARCHDHKFDPIPTKDYYSMASIFASTKSLAKVEGTVSQIYFAPLVPKDEYQRYEAHQKKIKGKGIEIQEVTAGEELKYQASLRPHLAEYIIAAFQYDRRPKAQEHLCLEDFARQKKLDPVVMKRWSDFLQPSDDVRPHLDRWFAAREKGLAAVSEVAKSYQQEVETAAAAWEQKIGQWSKMVTEAVAAAKEPPEKPAFEAGKNRFFASVSFDEHSPMALPNKRARGKKRAPMTAEKSGNALFSKESNDKIAALESVIAALKKQSPPEPEMACGVADGPEVQQHVFVRGNVGSPGEEAPKQFLQIIAGENQQPINHGSGRLELANWLTDPRHPLTTRVMVNRIWQYHFGEGLVRTPGNFGKLGETPTHPELLDYLAKRFVENGWSIKSMHCMMMLSSAYQMSSEINKKQMETDPSNRLVSHFNRRRLEVEEIRDGLLALDGALDLTMGGTLQTGFGTDGENSEGRLSINPDTNKRRTVYLPIRRSNLSSLFNLFDFGDATTPSEGRSRTNVAPQALFMMNGKFIAQRSRELAKKLLADGAYDERSRIESAYLATLGKKPADEEVRELETYIRNFRKKASDSGEPLPDPDLAAWQSFCRILMSSNDFIYVD